MNEQKKREEAEELASRNTGDTGFHEPDGSPQNAVPIDDSHLLPDSNLTAFGEPLPPPPSYEEVMRTSTEQLP